MSGLSVVISTNSKNYVSRTQHGNGVLFSIHGQESFADLTVATAIQAGVAITNVGVSLLIISDVAVCFNSILFHL